MDIGRSDGYAEYILPCVVNVLSEDDVILEFDISTDVSRIYLFSHFCNLYSLYFNFNRITNFSAPIFVGFVCIREKSYKLCKII